MSDELSASKPDDFEALIDLLALDDDDESSELTPQLLRHRSQPVLSTQDPIFATVSSNLRISPDLPRQEGLVELNEVRSVIATVIRATLYPLTTFGFV